MTTTNGEQAAAHNTRPGFSGRIIRAGTEHVAEMVALHAELFPDEAITRMGSSFLHAHHRYYATSSEGICFVAAEEDTGRVRGLVVGGKPELRYSFIRSHALRFALTLLWRACVDRVVRHRVGVAIGRFVRKLYLGRKMDRSHEPCEPASGTWSSLLYICTNPDFCCRGVGTELLRAFHAASARRGYDLMCITVLSDNVPAISLYRKTGWREVSRTEELTYLERRV